MSTLTSKSSSYPELKYSISYQQKLQDEFTTSSCASYHVPHHCHPLTPLRREQEYRMLYQ